MKRLIAVTALLVIASVLLWALTATYTWEDSTDWDTPWAFVATIGACDTVNNWNYSATGGNLDAPCRIRTCIGRIDNAIEGRIEWTGTWEDLGVGVGNTVSTVQMTDVATKSLVWATCDVMTIGPFELRNSSEALEATLWAGRSPTAQEGTYTNEGAQSAQSVGTLTASGASIEFWFAGFHNTGNDGAAECTFVIDDLDISIEHTGGAGRTQRVIITKVRFKNGKVSSSSSSVSVGD